MITQPTFVFSPLQAGVAAAGGALDVLEKRFGQYPWLNAKIEQLRDLADQDTDMVGKDVRLSMMRMSGRLVSKEEMACKLVAWVDCTGLGRC